MASTTTNLGLTKPAYTDDADVAVLNANSDIIDAAFGSLSDQIATLPTLNGAADCNACSTLKNLFDTIDSNKNKCGYGLTGNSSSTNLKTLLGGSAIGNYDMTVIQRIGTTVYIAVAVSSNVSTSLSKVKVLYRAADAPEDTSRMGQTSWMSEDAEMLNINVDANISLDNQRFAYRSGKVVTYCFKFVANAQIPGETSLLHLTDSAGSHVWSKASNNNVSTVYYVQASNGVCFWGSTTGQPGYYFKNGGTIASGTTVYVSGSFMSR